MNTLIFRTMAPILTGLMLLFSIIILLRGHNDPGGGFIGGLIAAAGAAVYGMAKGVGAVRRSLRFNPLVYAGFGVLLAAAARPAVARLRRAVSHRILVAGLCLRRARGRLRHRRLFVVFGTLTAIALGLEDAGEGG